MQARARIFILEDNDKRNKFFRDVLPGVFPGASIEMYEEADKAIEALDPDKHYDIILLDHDLGGRVFVNSNDSNTGYQVAKYIKENNISYGQCITHTQNPAGGANIKSVLDGCERIPFPRLAELIKNGH